MFYYGDNFMYICKSNHVINAFSLKVRTILIIQEFNTLSTSDYYLDPPKLVILNLSRFETITSKILLIYLYLSKKDYLWTLLIMHNLCMSILSFLCLIFNPLKLFICFASHFMCIEACADASCYSMNIQSKIDKLEITATSSILQGIK